MGLNTFVHKMAQKKGLELADATKPVIVVVNRRDINKARLKDPGQCAFACAVKRSHPDVKSAFFYRSCAWLERGDKLVKYTLPPSVQKEIVAFDRSKDMEPGNYQLSPVSVSQTRRARFAYNANRRDTQGRTGEGAPKKVLHRTANIRTMFTPTIKGKAKAR